MGFFILCMIVLLIIIALTNTSIKQPNIGFGKPLEINPYLSKNPLTITETGFYHSLVEALPEHIVLAQVQLSSIIKVDKSKINFKEYYNWFNPISQQSVDYLICTKSFSIVAAIELDDKSHDSLKAIERDSKKDKSLKAAAIPLIRWHAEDIPSTVEILEEVSKYLTTPANAKNNIENDWILPDEKEEFLNRTNKNENSTLQKLLFIGIFALGILYFYIQFQHLNLRSISFLENKLQLQKSSNSNAQNMNSTRPPQKLNKESAMQIQIKEQQRIQEVNQQKLLAAQENMLKELAWDDFYKKRIDCNKANVVDCGNDYIRNRREFEKYWEKQKSNGN